MSTARREPARFGEVLRHLAVAALWLLSFRLLSEHAVRLIPLSVARSLSLQAYLTGVQLVTLVVGLALSFLLLPEPRRALGLTAPRPVTALAVILAAPAIYVVASYVAFWVALPTLLAELAARGRQAVQASSGEFGRELVGSGLGLALVWGVLISPIGEELMFRGAGYGAVQSLVDFGRARLTPAEAAPRSNELPEGVLEPSAALAALKKLAGFFLDGGIAVLTTAGIFALMHADMPGGLGIVRWVSALGLGLATGLLRQATSGLAAPVLVHVVFNLCSIANSRHWLVTESLGKYRSVPILLSIAAAVLGLVALGVVLAGRGRRPPPENGEPG